MSYTVRCIFCKREHLSEFFDEIEEQILACRDRAPDWQRGRLATWPGPDPVITVEREAQVAGLAMREYAESFYPPVEGGP